MDEKPLSQHRRLLQMEEGGVNAESAPGEMDALVEGLKRLADAGTEGHEE